MNVEDHWPLFRLRVRTPRLELRLGTDDELFELAGLVEDFAGPDEPVWMVHDWIRLPPLERMRSVLQYQWGRRGDWSPDRWVLELQVFEDGAVVGTQAISAQQFPVTRMVSSGSWVGRAHRGRGIGTEMRAAVLHLAFAGLGAERAESEAYVDNVRSLGVSYRLGYTDNGIARVARGDGADYQQRVALERAAWEATRRDDIVVEGLDDACLAMFGGTTES